MTDDAGGSARSRLLSSGARLIAEKGFDGASVREICADAGTSINMVHHYFGSKQGLLDAIVEQFSAGVFATPLKLVEGDPESADEFSARMALLFETTVDAYIEHRELFLVIYREQADPPALPQFIAAFAGFLERAQERGIVRAEVDVQMVTGFFLDRILNQVQMAPHIARNYGTDLLSDADYRRRWCRSNLDVLLHGVAVD